MTCALRGHGPCRGRLDLHHVLKQQHVRSKFKHGAVWRDGRLVPLGRSALVYPEVTLEQLLADRRNLVVLCRHHHDNLHWARVYLEPPESAVGFARELGLEHVFDKQRERAA